MSETARTGNLSPLLPGGDGAGDGRELLDLLGHKLAGIEPGKRLRGIYIRGVDRIEAPHIPVPNAILAAAGMTIPGTGDLDRLPTLQSWLQWNPEVVLAERRHRLPLLELLQQPGWRDVEAVRNHRVYFFSREYYLRTDGHFAAFATWLASMVYTDAFADPALFAHREEILGERPVAAGMPYVSRARVVESRIGDYVHRSLLIDFSKPQRILSTLDGWRENVSVIGNSYAPPPLWAVNHLLGVERSRANTLRVLGLDADDASLLFTGADMDNLAVRSVESDGLGVLALVTAGVETNALRLSRDVGAFVEPGTINVILMTSRRLTPGAMANAVVSVTEAKTAALWDMDIRSAQTPRENAATGTGTDGVIVVQGEGAAASWVAGHAKLGQLIGEAVHAAVREAILRQNGLAAVRDPLARLEERRIHIEQAFAADSEGVLVRRARAVLEEPRHRGFFEAALALDDAFIMGRYPGPDAFLAWALDFASALAERPLATLEKLPGKDELPPILSLALRAVYTALKRFA